MAVFFLASPPAVSDGFFSSINETVSTSRRGAAGFGGRFGRSMPFAGGSRVYAQACCSDSAFLAGPGAAAFVLGWDGAAAL